MGLSNYAEDKLLDHLLGTSSFTMPSQVYLAAHTANPTDAGNGAEVATSGGTDYDRVAVDFDAASGGLANPTADVEFPEAAAAWGTVSHVAAWDHPDPGSGNMLMYGELAAPKAIDAGDTLRFPVADLDFTLD